MTEVHICPYLGRTVVFVDGICDSFNECTDCPVPEHRRETEEHE